MLQGREDAYQLLKQLGASKRLVDHAQFVGEAADQLLSEFKTLGVICNLQVIELGAILHDSGKIEYPEELSASGSLHEQAGQALLLAHGVQPEIASCCATHGARNLAGMSFEERVVALADKLWKGKREAALELSVIEETAARLGLSRWDVFERLDTAFEKIAVDGAVRIQRSKPQ